LLTPDLAREFLATNIESQRKVNHGYVTVLANDITNGNWKDYMPDDAVIMSKEGKMLNGQHRCLAVIKADKPIGVWYEDDVDDALFKYIDGGRARKAADFYKGKYKDLMVSLAKLYVLINDYNGTIIASCYGRIAKSYIDKQREMVTPSRTEILDCVGNNEEDFKRIAATASKMYHRKEEAGKYATPNSLAYSLWVIERVEGKNEMLDLFIADYMSDIPSSPSVIKLTNELLKMRTDVAAKRMTYRIEAYIALILAAYDSFKQGKPFTKKDVKESLKKWQMRLDIKKKTEGGLNNV